MLQAVFHIDELEKWGLSLANIKNFIQAEPTANIHVVVNSYGVQGLIVDSKYKESIQELANQNVVFKACKNALHAFDLEKKDILEAVEIVPAGVVELTKLQHEGFAYIRP